MSRIGKLPISLPEKVEVKVANGAVNVKGPKGSLNFVLPHKVNVSVDSLAGVVDRDGDDREARSLHGLCRSTIC